MTMMKNNNQIFIKKAYIKTCELSKNKDVIVNILFISACITEMYRKKRRIPFGLFDKNRTQENVKS